MEYLLVMYMVHFGGSWMQMHSMHTERFPDRAACEQAASIIKNDIQNTDKIKVTFNCHEVKALSH